MKNKTLILVLAIAVVVTACSYSIVLSHSQGTASDLVDDTDTTSVDATANIPITAKPI